MKKQLLFLCFVFAVGMTLFQSCKKEESTDPPKAAIFYSVVGKQAAFTALTKRIETWNWDFGDGETSTEKDPVHVYTDGGYYLVTLTATDASGQTAVAEATLAVDLTPYVLLTGGPTAVNGKTWKLTANHTANDKLANADATFTIAAGATFSYVENEDFAVPSVYGPEGVLTYTDVSTLNFSGTEFVGFMDNQRKVIVQEITDNSMRLVMFMAASPDYFPMNTHALVRTFEVVR